MKKLSKKNLGLFKEMERVGEHEKKMQFIREEVRGDYGEAIRFHKILATQDRVCILQ